VQDERRHDVLFTHFFEHSHWAECFDMGIDKTRQAGRARGMFYLPAHMRRDSDPVWPVFKLISLLLWNLQTKCFSPMQRRQHDSRPDASALRRQ
jgi:hypothetical protein